MTTGQRWVMASNNAKKIAECQALLSPLGVTLLAQAQLGVPEAPEPHATFLENALTKARHACRLTGLPSLADDSGLSVDALGGAPGVYSARYAALSGLPQTDAANNALLLERMRGKANRHARFVCVLVGMRSADDPEPLLAIGRWEGELLDTLRGQGGFGYDPLLWIPTEGCSAAELTPERKNQLSHRGQAVRGLWDQLQARRAAWGLST